MKKILRVQSSDDLLLAKYNEFDKIVLDYVTDNLNREDSRFLIRKSIYLAKEVEIVTKMKKDHILAAVLASCNPIKKIKWLEIRDTYIVNVTRQFP